jgi:hypothetical protein
MTPSGGHETEIGIVGDGPVAIVSAAGSVMGLDGGPCLVDWWVGAEDRWHRPRAEAAVRQSLGSDGSSIETRVRVPGGDVVHRVTTVPFDGSAVAQVEIENETSVPVAVAVTLLVSGGAVDVRDDTVLVDGSPVLRASRSVARVVAADTAEHLVATVEAGHAVPPLEADLPLLARHVAVIFPLPHTARLWFTVALDDRVVELAAPDRLPPLERVASGWQAHLDGGVRADLPDDRLVRTIAAARRHLLTGSGIAVSGMFWQEATPLWAPGAAAAALHAWGHGDAARDLMVSATDATPAGGLSPEASGSLLWGWAELLDAGLDDDLLRALRPWIVERVAELASVPRRRGRRAPEPEAEDIAWRALGLASAAPLLTRVGDERPARDIVEALPDLLEGVSPGLIAAVLGGHRLETDGRGPALAAALLSWVDAPVADSAMEALGGAATSTGAIGGPQRSHDPAASALLLLATRRALAYEANGSGGPVMVFGGIDTSWLGSSMEVHRVPIAGAMVDIAVRWHGDRPALLWDSGLGDVQLTAPGLDPSWSASASKGEALLAPTPSLSVEPGPESPQVQRGDDLDVGDEPGSFG